MPNRILIISMTFPPFPSVGGRRWTKFAKYLHRAGEEVFVLAGEAPKGAKSSWDKDIRGLNITRKKIFHPLYSQHSNPLIRKMMFKVGQILLPLVINGSIHDKMVLAKRQVLEAAAQIILEKKIDTLIITGAPFRALYWGTFLKKQFPKIKFIADLRDPWSWGHRAYGYDTLSESRRAFERKLEGEVLHSADQILVPGAPMLNKLKENYPAQKNKISVLPHGFDREEIFLNKVENDSGLKLVYFGTLYRGIAPHIHALAQIFARYPKRISLDIYSSTHNYQEIFAEHQVTNQVRYHSPLPTRQLFERVSTADFALMFKLLDYGHDNISTKYYELIASQTPILLLGPKGKASELVADNHLGIHLPVEAIVKGIEGILEGKKKLFYNKTFDTGKYDYEQLTQELIKLIARAKEPIPNAIRS